MYKIGFIDYFIDEWHANNYINWIPEVSPEFKVCYAWAEADTFEGKMSTDDWCREKNVEKCQSIGELCEKSDFIIILSPSNPEKHLAYATEALRYGKHTYIDKTFAPDLEAAEQIFAAGAAHGTKFFTTSALRYGSELDRVATPAKGVITAGGGSNFDEYVIHQIEMIVKLMGIGAEKVKVESAGKQVTAVISYRDGRMAAMNYSPNMAFAIDAEGADGAFHNSTVESDFFKALMCTIVTFFQTGEVPFDPAETKEVMAIRGAVIKAEAQLDTWIML